MFDFLFMLMNAGSLTVHALSSWECASIKPYSAVLNFTKKQIGMDGRAWYRIIE